MTKNEALKVVKIKPMKIIGIGKEYRPDEHIRGEWRDEDGVCVEFASGYRDCFYISEVEIKEALLDEPNEQR